MVSDRIITSTDSKPLIFDIISEMPAGLYTEILIDSNIRNSCDSMSSVCLNPAMLQSIMNKLLANIVCSQFHQVCKQIAELLHSKYILFYRSDKQDI